MIDSLDAQALSYIALLTQVERPEKRPIELGRRALHELLARAVTADARAELGHQIHHLEMNAGRPRTALKAFEAEPDNRTGTDRRLILNALFWDGDTMAAHAAVSRMQQSVLGGQDRCSLELWRAVRGVDGPTALVPGDTTIVSRMCANITDVLDRDRRNAPDAQRRLQSLDSLLRQMPAAYRDVGNIVVARIFASRGDHAAALAASRRRIFNVGGQVYMSTFLELQGSSAAAIGRKDEAAAAFSHYLRLREDPEPALLPRVERVRAELARLSRERN